jgi:hypothetical protein
MTAVQTTGGPQVTALAKAEMKRYARHPVFLVGAALWAFTSIISLNHTLEDFYGQAVIPAFFLGVFGIVVGFRLTRSMERAAEAVSTVPVPASARVRALLASTAVPALLGLVSCVAILSLSDVKGEWAYGTWSPSQRFAIILGQSLVAAVGGPLLGIAAACWLRFPGAVVVPLVVVVTWVVMANGYYASGHQDSTGWLATRLFSPFAFFTTLDTDGVHRVESWRGNPWFYLAFLVLLCVLAALVALAKGGEQSGLTRAVAAVVVAALACFALSVVTGQDRTTVRSPAGVSYRP